MSFSDVVNEIQGNEYKAMLRITEIADEQQKCLKEIELLNEKLEKANGTYNALMKNIEHVCAHIKKMPPMVIVKEKNVYRVSETFQIQVSKIDHVLPL